VWLDDELMKTYCGRESPGPNSYLTGGALGKQVRPGGGQGAGVTMTMKVKTRGTLED